MNTMGYREVKHNEKNGLDYVKNGDYWIPAITIPEHETGPALNRWGQARMTFLKEKRPWEYETRLIHAKLYSHCRELEQQAEERYDTLMKQLAKEAGATESLKASDPMKWVGLMNNCKAQAEEIIYSEMIYV